MKEMSLPEIVQSMEYFRKALGDLIIDKPEITYKQMSKDIGVSDVTLQTFIRTNLVVHERTLVRIYKYLRKIEHD